MRTGVCRNDCTAIHSTRCEKWDGVHDMTFATMSVVELAVKRHELMAVFNSKEVDDEAAEQEFEQICDVEDLIANANFESIACRAAGKLILMENIPSCWDNFQEELFLRMQQFA